VTTAVNRIQAWSLASSAPWATTRPACGLRPAARQPLRILELRISPAGRNQAALAVADRLGREGEPDQGRGRIPVVLRD
jgi:hypothetical protein